MAQPLRKNEDEFSQQPPVRQFNLHRYDTPRSGPGRWWFWLVMAVLIGIIVWWLQAPKSRPASNTPAPAVTAPAAKPALDVATLLGNPGQYAGQQVHLRDVLVQSANGDASIFVGPSDDQQVLVILKKGAVPETLQGKPRTLPKGDIVTVDGIAHKPGSAKDLEHSANLSRAQAEKVSKQGIVIEADRAAPQTM